MSLPPPINTAPSNSNQSASNKVPSDMQHWSGQVKKAVRLGWIIWSVAMMAQLLNMFHRVAGAAAVDKIMADFGITAAMIGGVLAMYFYIYAAMQFPSGVLADYLGPRKTVTFGCLMAGIGSIIFGLAPSLSILYLGRLLLSAGVAVLFISVLKLQTQWFPSRYFGKMTSLMGFVGATGSLAGATPMALFEIERRELGGISSFSSQNVAAIGFRKRLGMLLANKHIWPPFLVGLGSYGTLLVLQGAWGIPYIMQVYSMARDSAANFMLVMLIGHAAGLVILTFASERLQKRKLPTVIAAFAYLSLWIILTLWNGGKPPVLALYPICFLMGFFTSVMPITHALAKEVVPPFVSGMALGLVNMSIFLAAAVLQIVFGQMLDLGWQGAMLEGARIYRLTLVGKAPCLRGPEYTRWQLFNLVLY